jgi:hypothetical protein
MSTNDIQKVKKNTNNKLLIMGGIRQHVIDQADATEELIRSEVRWTIDEFAPGGSFLPCIPSLETINKHVTPIVIDECNRLRRLNGLKKQQG